MSACSVCAYCGREISSARMSRHLASCIFVPEVGKKLRQFLHDNAEDGCIMAANDYANLSVGISGLPSLCHLKIQLGLWKDITVWAGLKPHEREPYEPTALDPDSPTADPDLPATPHRLSAIPGWRVLGEWQPDAQCWRPTCKQQVWMLR